MIASMIPHTMVAWSQSTYGGPDVVTAVEVPVPVPGEHEVLLHVRATSLNSGDIHVMRGDPLLVRTAFGLTRPRVAVRGMDVAGTVVAVGRGVVELTVGDEVVGELPGGGLAPYALAPASRLVMRPSSVDPVSAAALPVAGATAWLALQRAGAALTEGARVLVIGASGGVGTYVVQLAALRGAAVHATCGARNRALVERLGASRTFDYRETDVAALAAESYDVVVVIAGTAPLRALQRLVRPGGCVVLVGGDGGRVLGPLGRILRAVVLSIGSKRPLRPLAVSADPSVLRELIAIVADGQLTPVIERTWPLAEAGAALAHVDEGHTTGKIVVTAE